MTILGCGCMNVLIHIETVVSEGEFALVNLTLDGITVQQSFLVEERDEGLWTVTRCKVCNCATHKRCDQDFMVYSGLNDYSQTVIDVQTGPAFVSGFNLILPSSSVSTDEESAAEPDLERLRKETSRLKRDMQILYEEKLADFIKSEKQILNSNLQKVENASQTIRSLVNQYHQSNKPLAMFLSHSPDPPVPGWDSISNRRMSISDKRVTFSVSEDPDIPDDLPCPDSAHHSEEGASHDDFFQFDMVDGEDDLFMTAPSGGLVYPGGEDYQEYQEQDGGSSSSGCEPDLVMEGKSVPMNVPMNYPRRSSYSTKMSQSVKVEDIAHSMKAMMAESHGDEEDVPRPRIASRSYNPSRLRH